MPARTKSPPVRGAYTDADRDRAVQMYLDGDKYDDIFKATGMPRPTVVSLLRSRGLATNRQRASDSGLTVEHLQEQLAQAYRDIGRLEATVENLQAQLEAKAARAHTPARRTKAATR